MATGRGRIATRLALLGSILTFAFLALLFLGVQGAGASTTCTYDGTTHTVDLQFIGSVETPTIYVGTGADAGKILLTSASTTQCGTATVSNTDTINMIETAESNVQGPIIDLSGGAFAPGFSNISGEIAFHVDLGAGNDTLTIQGSSATDTIKLGSDGINLNADTDADVFNPAGTGPPANVETVVVNGGNGDDHVLGTGSGAASSTAFTSKLELNGGPGDDELVGGDWFNTFRGGTGANTETGGSSNDAFEEGNSMDGSDAITGNGGLDSADYFYRTNSVTVSLDGVANDGETGEQDNVANDVETVLGGSNGDTLTGGPNADNLMGEAGVDTINGQGGSDELYAGTGGGTMDGGTGDDQLYSGFLAEPDVMIGGTGKDTANYTYKSAPVVVTLDGVANDGEVGEQDNVGTDVENVVGGSGNDQLFGDSDPNTLTGLDGSDLLVGGTGNDVLQGGPYTDTGSDTLEGGPGADQLNGWGGTDTADYSQSVSAVTIDLSTFSANGGDATGDQFCSVVSDSFCISSGTNSIENVRGSNNSTTGDALTGDGQDNVLTGGAGGDALTGGAGDDTFDEGAAPSGADTINGGTGTGDKVDYGARTTRTVVTLDGVANDGQDVPSGDSVEEGDNIGTDVENVTTGSGNDNLTGDGGANANVLNGGSGDDIFLTTGTSDGADTFIGGPGTLDFVVYSRSVGVVVTLDGNANDGQDLNGDGVAEENDNVGTDVEGVSGSSADDVITGNASNNELSGNEGADQLNGGDGQDTLLGQEGNDTLNGGPQEDALYGGDGNDNVYGDAGSDVLLAENAPNGGDVLSGGADDDVLAYNSRSGNLAVSQDGVANDGDIATNGGTGEQDNVGSDIETINMGPGNDTVAPAGGVQNSLDGGGGTNRLSYANAPAGVTVNLGLGVASQDGGGTTDFLSNFQNVTGSPFDDHLSGDANANVLNGGGGSDSLDGGFGADVLTGGGGVDTARYNLRTAPVTVSLDGVANDGEAYEGDNVSVENVLGGSGGDRLTGNGSANTLSGGRGADVLNGKGGNDTLTGGGGRDRATFAGGAAVKANLSTRKATGQGTDTLGTIEDLTGTTGADALTGSSAGNLVAGGGGADVVSGLGGPDSLVGGGGSDRLTGGPGRDSMSGGGGNDNLLARDNTKDHVNGGPGKDAATVDRRLDLVVNVEQLR